MTSHVEIPRKTKPLYTQPNLIGFLTSCGFVCWHRRFGTTCCLHLQSNGITAT